ncbi:hypothetical protein ACIQU5_36240 [Streptomyces sp. NPDC090306]|uniref:hypothetical protein n=1 Tax=Streptomyces sp. NPDC090306 TaxID=3365961 RepID=UPI00382F44CE
MVRVLLDGSVHVAYGQFYVEWVAPGGQPDMRDAFRGQVNGLGGGAETGFLFLLTGLHTGQVGLRAEWHETEPPLEGRWEEAVEVSLRPRGSRAVLAEWGGSRAYPLDLPREDHRVRYCATGMQAGRDRDTLVEGDPLDRYLLQFWPAAPAPDAVLRRTTPTAAYWHGWARELPPPPTEEEKAVAAAAQEQARQAELDRVRLAQETAIWGGRLPTLQQLRALKGNIRGLWRYDADLVEALGRCGEEQLRRVARHAARAAAGRAGLERAGWIAAALHDLDQGQPLPQLFDDPGRLRERASADDSLDPHYRGRLAVMPHAPAPAPHAPAPPVPAPAPPVPAPAPARPVTSPVSSRRRRVTTAGPTPKGLNRLGPLIGTLRAGDVSLPELETCLVDRIEPLHSVVVSLAPGAASLSSEARASLLRAADPNAPEVLTYLAVGVIPAADHPDPLQAACDALSGAVGVFGPDWPALLDGVRTLLCLPTGSN